MAKIKYKTTYVAGALVRNKIKREIDSYCFMHGIEIEFKEDRAWLNSQVYLTLTGKKEDIKNILDWLKDLEKDLDGPENS